MERIFKEFGLLDLVWDWGLGLGLGLYLIELRRVWELSCGLGI